MSNILSEQRTALCAMLDLSASSATRLLLVRHWLRGVKLRVGAV